MNHPTRTELENTMPTDPTSPLFADDQPSADLVFFARTISEESDALLKALPDALARQWDASTVPRPRDDTSQRSLGDAHSDPTADTALDPRRMEIRSTIYKSRQALYEAATVVRAARIALEKAVEWYDGER